MPEAFVLYTKIKANNNITTKTKDNNERRRPANTWNRPRILPERNVQSKIRKQ